MVGRNQPCTCGSGKKYKKCCERVVVFHQAELTRENRERGQKGELLSDLDKWFHRYAKVEDQDKWATRFKELLKLPLDQPIPKSFAFSFHYYLLFDAPCMNGRRPVELWASTIRHHRMDGERVIQSLSELSFSCFELLDSDQETMTFRSLQTNKDYEVMKQDAIPRDKLVFARLIRIGNRYELFGPYTSFVHEMRGEILVQLEKYNHHEEEQQELTIRETSWRVLGWSIQRANELETMEQQQLTSAPTEMRIESNKDLFLSAMEHQAERPGLPVSVLNHLEQFYVSEVTKLQKGTQAWYSRSLETLFQYLSLRFGQSFEWSLLNEDVLARFFSVWYMDHHQSTPISARIFLNICKHLFRWLESVGHANVFQAFKKVYVPFIRLIPETIEARTWMMENGVTKKSQDEAEQRNMFLLHVTSAGPVILIGEQWRPIQLRSFPRMWTEKRFWIKGTIQSDNHQYAFTQVENMYPVVSIDENEHTEVLLQK
jgi:hypothetical protein